MSDHPMCLPLAGSIVPIESDRRSQLTLPPTMPVSCSPPTFDVLCYIPLRFSSTPSFSFFFTTLFFFTFESHSPLLSCHNDIGLTSYVYSAIPLYTVHRLRPNTNLSKLHFSQYYLSKTSSPFTLHCELNAKFNLSLHYLPFFSDVSTFYLFF
jgi:hypothetical protein